MSAPRARQLTSARVNPEATMSDLPQVIGQSDFPVPLASPAQLREASCKHAWLWYGYLARGKVTGFVSQGKSGKTTLASMLLARLGLGGTLAGLPLSAGTAVVISEESHAEWDKRCQRLNIGNHVRFLCRPFKGRRPTLAQWHALVANLAELHRQQPIDLVLIDPMAQLLAGAENSAAAMLDALLPLQDLAGEGPNGVGPAVWIMHHPCKKKQADGQAGRGTVLNGFVDILVEMSCYKSLRSKDRRRRLRAYSRPDETPRHLLIELNAEATDYVVHTNEAGVEPLRPWPQLMSVLCHDFWKRTRAEMLQYWPEDHKKPNPGTLSRWLKRATQAGVILRKGTGLSGDPYRYWLPDDRKAETGRLQIRRASEIMTPPAPPPPAPQP
jgi:hypothetical protein